MNTSISLAQPRWLPTTRGVGRASLKRSARFPLLLVAAHIPLGLLLQTTVVASTAHAILTFAVGLSCVLQKRERMERVAYVGAYIAGAEVLWRMTGAGIPWEFGKYAISTIFIIAMLLHRPIKLPALPLIFFALLVPSMALTLLSGSTVAQIRDSLSFYMMGPFTLTISACFFANLKLTPDRMQKLFIALICPVLAIALLTLFGTLTLRTLASPRNRISRRVEALVLTRCQMFSVSGIDCFSLCLEPPRRISCSAFNARCAGLLHCAVRLNLLSRGSIRRCRRSSNRRPLSYPGSTLPYQGHRFGCAHSGNDLLHRGAEA